MPAKQTSQGPGRTYHCIAGMTEHSQLRLVYNLHHHAGWCSQSVCELQMGDRLTGGDIYATIQENSLMEHRMMVPPGARGKVTYLAPAGEYSLEDKVLELEFGDTKKVCTSSANARALPFFVHHCQLGIEKGWLVASHGMAVLHAQAHSARASWWRLMARHQLCHMKCFEQLEG